MTTIKNMLQPILSVLIIFLLTTPQVFSQTYHLDNAASKLTISGTSSLHDWDIDAEQQKGQLFLKVNDHITIEKLTLEITAERLKSGKSAMDKNTYKALDTKKHKSITFQLTEVKDIKSTGTDTYKVEILGNLTIAGVTRKQQINFDMHTTNSKVTLKGKNSFKMTDFGIEPPKALLGTITTGDQVTITFQTVLNQ